MWEKFKLDFKERFLTFETVNGVYLLPAGIIGLWITWTQLQFILHAMGTVYFGYVILQGARKIFVNRTKQALAEEKLLAVREQANVRN